MVLTGGYYIVSLSAEIDLLSWLVVHKIEEVFNWSTIGEDTKLRMEMSS